MTVTEKQQLWKPLSYFLFKLPWQFSQSFYIFCIGKSYSKCLISKYIFSTRISLFLYFWPSYFTLLKNSILKIIENPHYRENKSQWNVQTLNDVNGVRTHKLSSVTNTHPFRPVGLNVWVFVYDLIACGFESRCCHLNFRYRACLSKEFLTFRQL